MSTINELWMSYLSGEGYSGSLNERMIQALQANGSSSSNTLNEAMADFLVDEGYTGTLNEMLMAHLNAKGYSGSLQERLSQSLTAGDFFSSTPLEDAVDALIGTKSAGSYYKPYDYTTLFQDSSGTTPVTADAQDVAHMTGFNSGGTAINLTQATAGREMISASDTSVQGIQSTGANDGIFANISSVAVPITVGIRWRNPGDRGNTDTQSYIYMSDSVTSPSNLFTYSRGGSVGYNDQAYRGTLLNGSSASLSSAHYSTCVFDTNAVLRRDGSEDINASAGTQDNFTYIGVGGAVWSATNFYSSGVAHKYLWFAGAATAGEITTIEAWLAVDGDG